MSYSNGILSGSTSGGGKDGKDGLPGVGFKLTADGDFNMDGKKLTNASAGSNSSDAVVKSQLATKADKTMTENLDMNGNSILNLKTPTFDHDASTKAYADSKAFNGDMNLEKITNLGTPTDVYDAAHKRYVDYEVSKSLAKAGGIMTGSIAMSGQKISNLGEPTLDDDAATKAFVDKSHVTESGIQKNEFLYLMEDADESSSENNIVVEGIETFPKTPHTLFTKAYKFTMGKSAKNQYIAKIGFNLYKVPEGDYTFVVEYFPPEDQEVAIICLSTKINVNKQIFKGFPGYWKTIAQIQKNTNSPPEYLMVVIKCRGDSSSPSSGTGWMIVYGIKGTHNDVSSRVLDTPSFIDGGEQIMRVRLNMNMKELFNLPDPTHANDAANKKYVDEAGINSILNMATPAYIDTYIKEYADCLYSVERGLKSEVVFSGSDRYVETLLDQTLSLVDANQTVLQHKPTLSTAKNAKRLFLTFHGTDRMISNLDLNNDKVSIFILFRLHYFNGSDPNFRNGLFGHDNGGWDKFVCYTSSSSDRKLVIGGAEKDGSEVHTGFNTTVSSSDWKTKANASELNKWCLLSVHWDVGAGAGGSSCWVNTKKIKSFRARTSPGSTQMTFGDLNPNGLAPLEGDVQLFLVYKGREMSERLILAHHKMICERYEVDHETHTF